MQQKPYDVLSRRTRVWLATKPIFSNLVFIVAIFQDNFPISEFRAGGSQSIAKVSLSLGHGNKRKKESKCRESH